MGAGCSKKVATAEGSAPTGLHPRHSPWLRRQRSLSADTRAPAAQPAPGSLLALAVEAVCASLGEQPLHALRALPADLSQLLLDRLVVTERLSDASVCRLAGQAFFELNLDCYGPEEVKPSWLRCLASQPVVEVAVLNKTGATDDALAALGSQPRLHKLHLQYCVCLTNAALEALRGMPALADLSLKGCEALTQAGLAWIAAAPRLRILDLECCRRAGGVAALARALPALECLNLGWCSGVDDEDAAAIGGLLRLRELHLSRTKVTDAGLKHLVPLARLETLSLAGLDASDSALAALLPCLPALRNLNLQRCRRVGDGALAALGSACRGVEELQLAYTHVSDKGLHHLAGLPRLQVLGLEACDIGDTGLGVLSSLTALESLDIADTGATNGCMPAVCRLPRLRSLDLSFTEVNDWGLARLPRLAPSLVRLNLDSRLFSDMGMEAVAQLTGLTALDLFGAKISDSGCKNISKLGQLRSLEVCSGALTDAGVAALCAGLPRLAHLSVAHNMRITNAVVASLMRLPELSALNLSETRVTGNAVVALGCLSRLERLALQGTKVEAPTVATLRRVNPRLDVTGVLPLAPLPAPVALAVAV